MPPSQRLEVVVAGNIDSVRQSFRQLTAETTKVQQHFGRAGVELERASLRSSKAGRGAFRGFATGIGDVSTSLGSASRELGLLTQGLQASGSVYAYAAAATIGLGAAIYGLRDGETAAEVQARKLTAAQKELREAVLAAQKAATGQAQSFVTILQTQSGLEDSTKRLADARRALGQAEAKSGRDSRAYRDALLAVKQAELERQQSGRASAAALRETVAATQKAAQAIPNEIQALRDRKRALEDSILAARTFGVGANDLAKHERELAQVTDQLSNRLTGAAGRHREVGRTAKEMADALQGKAGPAARELRRQLGLLSKQEINSANKIDGINAVGRAANAAAGNVLGLLSSILKVNATPVRIQQAGSASLPGGRGQREGRGTHSTQSVGVVARNRPRLTVAERVQAALAGGALTGSRDDSLQDKQARAGAESVARQGGESEEVIRLRGEAAVLKRRRDENLARQRIVASGLKSVRAGIKRRIKQRDDLFAARRKISRKNTKALAANEKAINNVKQEIERLYDDERGLIDQAADLAAEAAELGFDAGQVEAEISTAQAAPADGGAGGSGDSGGGGGGGGASAAEAAVALADLTADTADDVATRKSLLGEQQAALEAAKAKGDNAAIIQLAGSIKSLTEEISRLTGATEDNTVATQAQSDTLTGSTVFEFRSQRYVAGQSSDTLVDVGVGG